MSDPIDGSIPVGDEQEYQGGQQKKVVGIPEQKSYSHYRIRYPAYLPDDGTWFEIDPEDINDYGYDENDLKSVREALVIVKEEYPLAFIVGISVKVVE